MIDADIASRLRHWADVYETADFLQGDPSWFMHQVVGRKNQETMAFLASVLSYGSRAQFLPKIQLMLDASGGELHRWVRSGAYSNDIPDSSDCYYRLYTCHTMNVLLGRLRLMLAQYDSIGRYVESRVHHRETSGREAVVALSEFFQDEQLKGVVPQADSACKRIVMFLRWMARTGSPVDLGLWSGFIDRRTIFIPLDTHVLQQAHELGLVASKTQSWSTVVKITDAMREIFPEDPAKGDFALFGYDINKNVK